MAYQYNLYMDQGSDFSIDLTLLDDTGVCINLTGYEVYAQFKKGYGTKISFEMCTSVLNALAGEINLFYCADDSMERMYGSHVYDIKIYNPTTDTMLRVVEGDLVITPGVTL